MARTMIKSRWRRIFLALFLGVALVAATVCGACVDTEPYRRAATSTEIAAGDALAHKMSEAIGKQAFDDNVQSIAFSMITEALGLSLVRKSAWDKRRGLYRFIDGDTVVWLDLWDKTGAATDDGAPVTDEDDLKDLLDKAEFFFINDLYWFLAPFKVFDPGAHRADVDGQLRISFDDGVGMTSGDVYLYEIEASGMPRRWSFRLESGISASFALDAPVVKEGATFFLKRTGLADVRFDEVEITGGPKDAWFAPLLAARTAKAAKAAAP